MYTNTQERNRKYDLICFQLCWAYDEYISIPGANILGNCNYATHTKFSKTVWLGNELGKVEHSQQKEMPKIFKFLLLVFIELSLNWKAKKKNQPSPLRRMFLLFEGKCGKQILFEAGW